jgi:uncharacterized protein (TIGR03067 family)
MTRPALTACVTGLLLAATPAPEEDDAQKLQGARRATSLEVAGKEQAGAGRHCPAFEKDTFVFKGEKEVISKGTFMLDPSRKPGAIDLTFRGSVVEGEAGRESHAIYDLGNGTLRLCLPAAATHERPKGFTTKDGAGHALWGFKREKP